MKRKRLDELMALQEEIATEINSAKVGQVLRVIIDREEVEYYVGRTQFDSPEVDPEVLIIKNKALNLGEFYNVKITSAQPFDLFGEIV